MITKLKALKKGDAIGVYSPSGAIEEPLLDAYNRGKSLLVENGLRVIEAPNTFCWTSHYSAVGKTKVADLKFLLANPEVKAILPSIGGTTSYQLLELFPYEEVLKAQKLIFGFSDNSLQAAIVTSRTGLITFHGHSDVVFGLGDLCDLDKSNSFAKGGTYTKSMFLDTIFGRLLPGPVKKASEWKVLRGGTSRGRLMGGNLDVLQILHGTKHELDLRDAILFWEVTGIDLHRVDLILAGFRLTGQLDNLAGMVIGKADSIGETFYTDKHESFYEIVMRHCEDFDFPIIVDADIGHDMECAMLPLGIDATIDGDNLILNDTPFLP